METVIYGNDLHVKISEREMKEILQEKFGVPIEDITCSSADLVIKLIKD